MTQTPKRANGWPDKKLEPGGGYFHRNRGSAKTTAKLTFCVDLDSVIYDMESVLQDCVKLVTGVYPAPAHTWDCEVAWGVSADTATKIWDLVWQMDIKPYPGAYNFLNLLSQKFKVVSLSTRKPGAPRNHGLAMTADLPVDQKIWTRSPDEKADFLRTGNVRKGSPSPAAYFLDDSPANHYAARRKTPIPDLLLMDRPWNQSQDIDPIWRRVHSYEEVLKLATE